jgi:hypothetical protein
MSKYANELIEYIFLLMGLLVFFMLTVIFSHNTVALKIIAFSAALFYLVWGLVHHGLRERLKLGIVLEYLFLGIMVVLLFYLVLGF